MNPQYAVARVTRRGFVVSAAVWVAGCAGGGGDGSDSEESGGTANPTTTETPTAADGSDGGSTEADPTQTPTETPGQQATGEYPYLISGQEAEKVFSRHLQVESDGHTARVELRDPENRLRRSGDFEHGYAHMLPNHCANGGLYRDGSVVGVVGDLFLNSSPYYEVATRTVDMPDHQFNTVNRGLPGPNSEYLVDTAWGHGLVIDVGEHLDTPGMEWISVGVSATIENANDDTCLVIYQPGEQ